LNIAGMLARDACVRPERCINMFASLKRDRTMKCALGFGLAQKL
jgi:hypothetical protein